MAHHNNMIKHFYDIAKESDQDIVFTVSNSPLLTSHFKLPTVST
jgi:hypothetical protein